MDSRKNSASESGHKVSLTITSALVSAILEWMLMFMIFVDAGFAYLVTRFARHHRLQIPCLFCSRLDHVLGNERAGFYWGLICHEHKSKISSLVLCQLHNNLVDLHGICENCFCSFDPINKSNAETYRLPVGKLGVGPCCDALALGDSSDELNIGLSTTRKCICCNEKWISGTCSKKFERKSIENGGAKHDTPSSLNHTHSGNVAMGIKQTRLEQIRSKHADPLPHVEYSQIKDASDTESEGRLSGAESATPLIREMETSGQELESKFVIEEPQITILDPSPAPEKLIHPDPPTISSCLESDNSTFPHHNVESEAPGKSRVVAESEFMYFTDVYSSPNPDGTHFVDSNQSNDATCTIESEKDVHVECREHSNPEIGSTCTDDSWKQVTECQENSRVGSNSIPLQEIQMNMKTKKTEMTGPLDLGDAYRLAIGTRGRQLSGKLEQQRSITDRVSEDLKLLLSQISAARGLDLPLTDMSPKLSATANTDDCKVIDASVSIGMQVFSRKISLERNESNLSIDGSSVSEIEGESEVDRLKRQVEHDKKVLNSVYKELEEERNASAIAANQAMAMITRLQEEKAAFHMEALQCVRMMEEQAEYDGEALQRVSLLLAEKEKQIQHFRFELDIYRNGFGGVPESETDELKEQILENEREECL